MELHIKYRPKDFDSVIGQDHAVRSLRAVVSERKSRAFVFTGPSGVGKTTLSRVVARELGCDDAGLLEIDAATHTGVDAWRAIRDGLRYAPLGKGKVKCVIVDEAHALSKSAWQSMLKDVEEGPAHVHWFFCTTESGKIPPTILTRCVKYDLQPVRAADIFDLLAKVVEAEGGGPPEEILDFVSRNAGGSVREALVSLATCWKTRKRKTAAKLMRAASDDGEAVEIFRGLASGRLAWGDACRVFKSLQGTSAESLRIQAQAYFEKVLLGAKSPSHAERALPLLEAFSTPYPPGNSLAPFILDVASLVLGVEE